MSVECLQTSAAHLRPVRDIPHCERLDSCNVRCCAFANVCIAGQCADLEQEKLLTKETFWDNRDWIGIAKTSHSLRARTRINNNVLLSLGVADEALTYGSPDSGYSFTELSIDHSGRRIWRNQLPAGHQLYEARWLRKPTIAHDYLKYWFRTPGAQRETTRRGLPIRRGLCI